MLFSSPRYAVFILIVLILLGLPTALRTRKNILVVASSIFYAAWDWRYLGLLALISIIDFVAADKIHASENQRTRKAWIVFSVGSNLAILGYFKYFNFFLENLNGLLAPWSGQLPYKEILLPAGISFYTFKSMSYTLDVYRRHIKPCANYLDYAMFITFFPELIAGPIVRASVFLPQMERVPGPSRERLRIGLGLFVMGLVKKRVIADHLAGFVDPVFANPALYSAASVWVAVIGYALQIYCDFSGYSDMAIGSAKMIGYELPENFLMPYLSPNITVFWRRWHMTLSSWLRDYLYIPLGGNRRGYARTYVNLFLTMLLGGLWHGASWNFVLWGALHGTALAGHKLWMERLPRFKMPAFLGGCLTFLFVILCWIPFRAPTFAVSVTIFKRLFSPALGVAFVPPIALACAGGVLAAHILGYVILRQLRRQQSFAQSGAARVLAILGLRLEQSAITGWSVSMGPGTVSGYFFLTLVFVGIVWTAVLDSSAFIYFQF